MWGPPNLAALFVLFSFRRGHFDSKEITDNIQLQTRMWFGTIVRQEPHAGKNSLELKRLDGGCGAAATAGGAEATAGPGAATGLVAGVSVRGGAECTAAAGAWGVAGASRAAGLACAGLASHEVSPVAALW